MYKILFGTKRFNNKTFVSYEEARKYVRRKITEKFGYYLDNIGSFGFKIIKHHQV